MVAPVQAAAEIQVCGCWRRNAMTAACMRTDGPLANYTLLERTENPRPVASPVTGQTDCSPALHTQPAIRALDLSLLLPFFLGTPQTKTNLY